MKKQDKKTFIGKIIKNTREEKGLTQLEVSNNIGISRNYLSDIENGRYMPSVNTLLNLASFLKIDLNFFNLNDGNTI